MTSLSWEGMSVGMGVDPRQVLRWRRGGAPNGGAMLSLVRVAIRVPGGLGELLDEDVTGDPQTEEAGLCVWTVKSVSRASARGPSPRTSQGG